MMRGEIGFSVYYSMLLGGKSSSEPVLLPEGGNRVQPRLGFLKIRRQHQSLAVSLGRLIEFMLLLERRSQIKICHGIGGALHGLFKLRRCLVVSRLFREHPSIGDAVSRRTGVQPDRFLEMRLCVG